MSAGSAFFLIFCMLFLVLGLLEARRTRNLEDFCLAGRRSGGFAAGLSIAASCIGASATIGICGLAFHAGFPAVWWLVSGAVGLGISAVFLIDRIRREKPLTLLGALRLKAGDRTAQAAGIVILAAWVGILAAQFSAMGRLISAAFPQLSPQEALLAGSAFIVGATLLGGQRAVIRSDVFQSALMCGGFLLLLGLLLADPASHAPSFEDVELLNDAFGWSDWSEFMLLIGGSYLVCPMLSSRFLAARTPCDARIAAGVGILSLAAAAVVITLIGIAAQGMLPADTPSDAVLPALLESRPPLFGALFLVVMTGAVLSSADSCLMTAASVGAVDLAKRRSVRATRIAALLISAAALLAAMSGKGVLELLLAANALYVCGVVPAAFAVLMRSGRRTNTTPADERFTLLGIALGTCFGALGETLGLTLLYGIGFALSCVITAAAPARRSAVSADMPTTAD